MKHTHILPIFSILLIISLTGCSINEKGNSLHAFTERMNQKSEAYSLTENGYIFNDTENTLTRFYKFNKNEIMLRFTYDENNSLNQLDLVFPNECVKVTEEFEFIKACIGAYINDPQKQTELLNEVDFDNAFKKINYDTIKAKSGDTEILIDVTEIGTVITIIQNNL